MAAGSSHKLYLTFPASQAGASPDPGDLVSGVLWLYDRSGEPVRTEAGAVIATPAGGNMQLEPGGVVHRWVSEQVSLEHSEGGQTVAGFVTPALWANTGTLATPSDHLMVDGFDGTHYRWRVMYHPAGGGQVRVIEGSAQLDATVDYEALGNTVEVESVECVLSSVLDEETLSTSGAAALIDSRISSYGLGGALTGTPDDATVADDSHSHTAATLPAASDTAAGLIETATQAEVDAGTLTNRAVTPARLAGSALQAAVAANTSGLAAEIVARDAAIDAAIHDPTPAAAGDRYTIGTYTGPPYAGGGAARVVRYHLEFTGWTSNTLGDFHILGRATHPTSLVNHENHHRVDIEGFAYDKGTLQRVALIDRSYNSFGPLDMNAAVYLSNADNVTVAFDAFNYYIDFTVWGVRSGSYTPANQQPGLSVTVTETTTAEI